MNRKDDFDHTLAAWLRREAPPQAPDRVLDAALERVAAQSQQRGWLQRLLGETHMATLTRVAGLTAVIALAALVGLQFANLAPDIGASSPSPSEVGTPSAVPTASLPAGCVNPPTDITTLIDLASTGPLDPAGDPVACYGNAPLTFDATWVGGGVADCPAQPEPAWLACSAYSLRAVGDTRKLGGPDLFVAVDPSVSFSPSGVFSQVRVTGHFDDPAAQTCREIGSMPGESPRPAAEVIESCRRAFVITEVVPFEPSPAPFVVCVNPPADITDLINQTDKVACYGNAPLTIDASRVGFGAFSYSCAPTVEPTWLSCQDAGSLMPAGSSVFAATFLFVAIDPASGISLAEYFDTDVRITGHFDDPAAQTCREIEPIPGESPRPAAEVIESCRRIFVVTQVVPLAP